MNPLIPTVSSAVTRRDALKALGAGAALLGLGLTEPRSGSAEKPLTGQEPSNPPDNALEPQFAARSTIKLPLA